MRFGALGDIHGDFDSARRIMRQHPGVPFWVSVGDVAGEHGHYEPVDAPLHFIKGNNENFDRLAAGDLPANLHYIRNAQLTTGTPGVRVAGLGGTFAPTWYDTQASDLPHPIKSSLTATTLADKRRHFVREEVEACRTLRDVDLFLTHEAPRPYRVGKGIDAGKTPVNEVLAAMRPRLHLFGHHHRFSEQDVQGGRSVGLDLVSRSYLLIDGATMQYHVMSDA
jgi:calcineurin-like phosphoesterase family protein